MYKKNYLNNRFFFKNISNLKNFINCYILFKNRLLEGQILNLGTTTILDIGFKYTVDLHKYYSNGDYLFLKLNKSETVFNDFCLNHLNLYANYIYKFNWVIIKKIFQNKYLVLGRFLNIIRGGFSIGICGIIGFLPKKCFVFCNCKLVSAFSITNLNLIKKTFTLSQKHINKIASRALFKLPSKIIYVSKN
jgi:hypothetical protein